MKSKKNKNKVKKKTLNKVKKGAALSSAQRMRNGPKGWGRQGSNKGKFTSRECLQMTRGKNGQLDYDKALEMFLKQNNNGNLNNKNMHSGLLKLLNIGFTLEESLKALELKNGNWKEAYEYLSII